jgi:hypothetical protein
MRPRRRFDRAYLIVPETQPALRTLVRADPSLWPSRFGTLQSRSGRGATGGVPAIGCQSGSDSLAGLFVRSTGLLPSAFMTKTSLSPIGPRFVVNAILVPSGDQVGSPSFAASFVRFVWPLPSAFMTKISPAPPK